MTFTNEELTKMVADATPGPWHVELPDETTTSMWVSHGKLGDADRADIAKFEPWEEQGGDGEGIQPIDYANAMLIAQTPTLATELAAAQARITALEADLYLVWSYEHGCWWRPNSAGYTNDARAAGVYTRAEALSISHRGRDGWREGATPDELPVRLADMPEWVRAALATQGAEPPHAPERAEGA